MTSLPPPAPTPAGSGELRPRGIRPQAPQAPPLPPLLPDPCLKACTLALRRRGGRRRRRGKRRGGAARDSTTKRPRSRRCGPSASLRRGAAWRQGRRGRGVVAEDEARIQVPLASAVGAEGVSDDEESGEINPELFPSSGTGSMLY
ncbi:hypothetical protein ACQJBY_016071 [Aegilops geniculata]